MTDAQTEWHSVLAALEAANRDIAAIAPADCERWQRLLDRRDELLGTVYRLCSTRVTASAGREFLPRLFALQSAGEALREKLLLGREQLRADLHKSEQARQFARSLNAPPGSTSVASGAFDCNG